MFHTLNSQYKQVSPSWSLTLRTVKTASADWAPSWHMMPHPQFTAQHLTHDPIYAASGDSPLQNPLVWCTTLLETPLVAHLTQLTALLTCPLTQRLMPVLCTAGSHSGVKLCRWTKSMLRGRGGCYKHSFYGIESHRCMETTPSLACANKCVFCWRHHTNPGQSACPPCLGLGQLCLLCSSCFCCVQLSSRGFQFAFPGFVLAIL